MPQMERLNTGTLDPAFRSAVSAQQDTAAKPQPPLMSPWQRAPEQHPLPSLSRIQLGHQQAHHDHTSALLGAASAFSPQSTASSIEALPPARPRHRESQPSLYRPPTSTLTPPDDPVHHQQSHDTPADHDHDHDDDNYDDTHTADEASPAAAAAGAASADAKKPRACESCRALKVRCDFPDPTTSEPGAPCRRCERTKRRCVVTQPSRKRQRKTDTRVAELEKKIDALTASLVASRGAAGAAAAGIGGVGEVSETGRGSVGWEREGGEGVRYPIPPQPSGSAASSSPGLPPLIGCTAPASAIAAAYAAGKKRKLDDGSESGEEARLAASAAAALAARDVPPGSSPFIGSDAAKELSPDVVEKGLLTLAHASELLKRYMTKMCPHLPAVVFPPTMTAAELRASKPILFLAIMAAASSESGALQQVLTKELMQVLAERIIVRGSKTLEVVQAVQVAVIWYYPPDRFEDLKFYQLVHISAVMAIELGLGRRKAARGGFRKHIAHAWRDHPLRKQPPPDPTTFEARRAWLTCYFMATNTAMALHRPNLIRWTPFIAESMNILQNSPDAAPTDKYLCHLVWTHKLAEDVGIQFSMDDPASTPNLADPRTQHTLKGFEHELERYRESIPKEMHQPSLQMSFHVIDLYMHELVTHTDSADDGRLLSGESAFGADIPLSGPHISALSACLSAIDGIIDVFLSLDVPTIRTLPVFNIVRVAYAVVVLIKIYFAACSPKTKLGSIISKDDMKVEQHLDNLLEKFRATAAEGKSRPASKFLIVLVMIRAWFHKHKQSQNGGANQGSNPAAADTASSQRGSSTPVPQQKQPQPQPGYASTPLHLLSEVATNKSVASGSSGTRSSASANLPPVAASAPLPSTTPDPWLSNRQQQLMYDPITNSTTPLTSTTAADNTSSTPSSFIPGVPPTPTPQQTQNQGLPQTDQEPANLAGPYLSNAFNSASDWDYGSGIFGVDGFAQAMDLTFGGFMDGGGMEDGFYMANAMQEQGWFTPPAVAGVGAGVVAAEVGMEGDGGAGVGGVGVTGEGDVAAVAAAAAAGGYGY